MTTRPRVRSRTGHILSNPVAAAIYGACKLSELERQAELQPPRQALRQLRTGVALLLDWQTLASTLNVAQAVEKQGIVRGAEGHLHAAELALQAINQRAGDALPFPIPHLEEIEVLQTALDIFALQVESLSRRELRAAKLGAYDEVRSTGGLVVDVDRLSMRQEALAL